MGAAKVSTIVELPVKQETLNEKLNNMCMTLLANVSEHVVTELNDYAHFLNIDLWMLVDAILTAAVDFNWLSDAEAKINSEWYDYITPTDKYKVCDMCGKQFEVEVYGQMYCSGDCGSKAGSVRAKLIDGGRLWKIFGYLLPWLVV